MYYYMYVDLCQNKDNSSRIAIGKITVDSGQKVWLPVLLTFQIDYKMPSHCELGKPGC